MTRSVRQVPLVQRNRCPDCGAFISHASSFLIIHCTACGFALATGPRRAETRPFEARCVAGQSGPQGNAHITSTRLFSNGKTLKTSKKTNDNKQMELFTGVFSVDGSGWLQQEAS